MDALQGAKKIVTGLETFMTGAENLQKIKKEQSGGQELMSRLGGAVGGLTGLFPGATHAQGRGGGYYGLQTIGESFALPAQQFLGLQARRAPTTMQGPQGGIVSVDPRRGTTRQVMPPTVDTTVTANRQLSEALSAERQGISKEKWTPGMIREWDYHVESRTPETKARTLEQAKLEAWDRLSPEQQEGGFLASMGYDVGKMANLNLEQLQSMAWRQSMEAFSRGDLEGGKRYQATYEEAKEQRKEFETLRAGVDRPQAYSSFEQAAANLLVAGDMPGAKRIMDFAKEYDTDTEQELPLSGRVADAYRRGTSLSGKAAGLKAAMATTPSTLDEALEVALLHRESPLHVAGRMGETMLVTLEGRNPIAYAMLEKAKLLDEYGELLPEISWANKAQYSGGKAVTPTPSPVPTPSPTPTQTTASGSPSVATRWLEQQLYDLEQAKTR